MKNLSLSKINSFIGLFLGIFGILFPIIIITTGSILGFIGAFEILMILFAPFILLIVGLIGKYDKLSTFEDDSPHNFFILSGILGILVLVFALTIPELALVIGFINPWIMIVGGVLYRKKSTNDL